MKSLFAVTCMLASLVSSIEGFAATNLKNLPKIRESWCTSVPMGSAMIRFDPRPRIALDDSQTMPLRRVSYCVSINSEQKTASFYYDTNDNSYNKLGEYRGGTESGTAGYEVDTRVIEQQNLKDGYVVYTIALDNKKDGLAPRTAISIIYDAVRKKWTDQASLGVARQDLYKWEFEGKEAVCATDDDGKKDLTKKIDQLDVEQIRVVRQIKHEFLGFKE